MPRQAAILRFWFAALAVALLGLWEPCLWFGVVPLFFWGGCPCCGSDCGGSCDSGTGPGELTLTMTGIAAGTCSGGDCTSLNGTYVSEFFDTIGDMCRYRGIGATIVCGGTVIFNALEIQVGDIPPSPGGGFVVQLIFTRNGSPDDTITSDSLGSPPLDCSAIWPVDVPNVTASSGLCDFSAATITVDV